MNQSFTFLGEGFGKYMAILWNKFDAVTIPDGEYVKIIAEQGFIGLFLTISLMVLCLIKAGINFRNLYYEFSIICMLAICMIEAAPLPISNKHSLYFGLQWDISRFKSKRYGKNTEVK